MDKYAEQTGSMHVTLDTCEVAIRVCITLAPSDEMCSVCSDVRQAAVNFLYGARLIGVEIDGEYMAWEQCEMRRHDIADRIEDLLKLDIQGNCICSLCLADRFHRSSSS